MYGELVICIFGPIIFTAISIYLKGALSEGGESSLLPWRQLGHELSLHPEKGLADQGLLWASILLPAAYFFMLGGFAWKGCVPALTADGFNLFIEISKLPMAALALCIPLAVLVSRLHATKQTAAQITSTKHKNNFDMFLSHRKSMIEYFSALGKSKFSRGKLEYEYSLNPLLHNRIFKADNPLAGIPDINTKYIEELLEQLDTTGSKVRKIAKTGIHAPVSDEYTTDYLTACKSVHELASTLSLSNITSLQKEEVIVDNKIAVSGFYTIGTTFYELNASYLFLREYIFYLCIFANHSVQHLSSIRKSSKIPLVGITGNGNTALIESVISTAKRLAKEDPQAFATATGMTVISTH